MPIIQRAQINYLKRPLTGNRVMVRVVKEMKSFWTLSMPGLKFGNQQMLKLKMVSNGPDKTLGNMVPSRVQKMINDFKFTFGTVDTAAPNVRPGVDHDQQVRRSEDRTLTVIEHRFGVETADGRVRPGPA